ncbi:P-selectin glycoprotein ligand 1-like [Antennarius striatus]|uniref:P-selectin glycoprotein ligand 1-like n=1 Tax=Antennarius striatus TaxID=241820 RepID=UPI0035B2EBF1
MVQLSMKMCLCLVWAASALFAVESVSDSILETSSIFSTAGPEKTTTQLINVWNGTETQSKGRNPNDKPADISSSAPTVKPEETTVPQRSDTSEISLTSLVTMSTAAVPESSSGQWVILTSREVVTVAGEAQSSPITVITEPVKPPEEQLHEQSPPTSVNSSDSAAAATSGTEVVSLSQSSSTYTPGVVTNTSSTDSPDDPTETPTVIQNLKSTSVSVTSIKTGSPASKGAPHSTVNLATTEFLSSSQPQSVTSFSTTDLSTAGGSKLRIPKTKMTTAATQEATKSPPSTNDQPCFNRTMMKRCLIVIASLAGLATVFMVSTIILCAKLSTRKYKVRRPQQATEMVSISALMPEMSYSYLRPRNPVTNGVLVMRGDGDSDEDGDDNMTLSSFLPENDRLV